MDRRLVWTCGGVVLAGVLVYWCVAAASHPADQAQVKNSHVPSTPAPVSQGDPVLGIEQSIQRTLLKDGMLVAPGPGASAQERKAYDYALESKQAGKEDQAALRAAAERIWQEKKDEHRRRMQANQENSDERAKLNRARMQEKIAERKATHPEPVGQREKLGPPPGRPNLGPAFIPDPDAPAVPTAPQK